MVSGAWVVALPSQTHLRATDMQALVSTSQRSMSRRGSLLSMRVFWNMCCERVREF